MMQKTIVTLVVLAVVVMGGYYLLRDGAEVGNDDVMNTNTGKGNVALFETNYGNFKVEFYAADAPKTVENFISLANKNYYDGLIFHRVIEKFMIQGGDPECVKTGGRCGTGGPGYRFEDELNPATPSYQAGYKKGVMAMANAGPNTNGSQFFIMVADVPLPHDYTIFGKVIDGQSVVDAIGGVDTDSGDRPIKPVTINKVTIQS